MILAHKVALDPTKAQAEYFARAAGVARFAWNWSLARWRQEYALWREYQCGPKPSELALRRELNALKDEAFPWMRGVTKNAPQQAIKNLGAAFKNFFEGSAKFPQFKKKGASRDSFRADSGPPDKVSNAVEADGKRVRLPIIGWVRTREALRFKGRIKSATVSLEADRWFVSLTVEMDHVPPVRESQVVGGVDLGEGAGDIERRQRDRGAEGVARQPDKAPPHEPRPEPQGERLGQPPQGGCEAGQAARAHRQHPAGRAAQGHHWHRAQVRGHRDRGPERARHDAQRPPRTRHRGHRRFRVPAAAQLQGAHAHQPRGGGGPLVPVKQAVLGLWPRPPRPHAKRPGMDVPGLWRCARPRRQRGYQPEISGREFAGGCQPAGAIRWLGDSLWRGKLWRAAQVARETGLCEAGTRAWNACPCSGER
ncbi:MAG: helix-turn-helix domain-containing protein [Acetobacteraceae bacterium]|nr:helix-turn-helix domain-containing protein [Acetobacteraceae bacterium]